MDLTRSIDIYCERTDAGLWAEPVNALTNLAFVAAAVFLLRRLRACPPAGRATALHLRLLVWLVFCIGIGSALFHTSARVWSAYADMLFIALFIYAYYAFFLRHVVGLGWPAALFAVAVWEILGRGVQQGAVAVLGAGALNGSEAYLPPFLALILMAAWGWRQRLAGARLLAATAGVFAVSLALRTVDLAICERLPLGTHFLWHVLNALALGLAVVAAEKMHAAAGLRRSPNPQ
jgi:hypothetical protein